MNYEWYNDPVEVAGGRLKIGHAVSDHTPVYFDPETGLTSFGCSMVPLHGD